MSYTCICPCLPNASNCDIMSQEISKHLINNVRSGGRGGGLAFKVPPPHPFKILLTRI